MRHSADSTNSRTSRFDARSGLTLMCVANTFASTTVEYPQPVSTDVAGDDGSSAKELKDLAADRVRRATGAVDLAGSGRELILEGTVDRCRVGVELRSVRIERPQRIVS